MVIKGPSKPTVTLETFRKLAHLSGSRGMQITETLGYFSENQHLLLEEEYRRVLKSMFLDPSLIELELAENSLLAGNLAEFCKEQYSKAKTSGDILLASYFLRLNQYFYESISRVNRSRKLGIDISQFMNSRDELIGLIQSIDKNKIKDKVTKDILFRDMIRTFLIEEEFKTAEDVKWFLISNIFRKSFPQSEIIDRDIENEIFDIVMSKQGLIRDFLGKNQDSLKKVLKYFINKNVIFTSFFSFWKWLCFW